MQNIVNSNVDLGDGLISWLHVVAPVGRGIYKNAEFSRVPDSAKAYIQNEYNEMRRIAATLIANGSIDKDTPILYPEYGGIVAAQAIADVTGGKLYSMTKETEPKRFTLSGDTKDVLAKAKHIIIADENIHTGNVVRKMNDALKDSYKGKTSIITNRMFKKFLMSVTAGSGGGPGGFIGMFLPKDTHIYTGGIYTGHDVVKASEMLAMAKQQGFKMESLRDSTSLGRF